jgi:hypothetical protein
MDGYEEIQIAGSRVFVPPPETIPNEPFIGRKDLIEKTLAAWSAVDGTPPLHFRLFGPPGTGKNSLIYELARILDKDLYIIDGNDDLSVEDVACVPAIDRRDTGTLYYVASPLFAAILRGGIAFFDEIAKAPHGTLAALASVLDRRGTLTSTMAAIRIKAAPGFLFCAALNEDEETGIGLPGYIQERTSPAIFVGNPSLKELKKIIKSQVPGNSDIWIEGFISLYKESSLSPRSAIKLIGNAIKLYRHCEGMHTSPAPKKTKVHSYLKQAAGGFSLEMPDDELPPPPKFKSQKKRSPYVYRPLSEDKKGTLH